MGTVDVRDPAPNFALRRTRGALVGLRYQDAARIRRALEAARGA